jgi:hypothetical protein
MKSHNGTADKALVETIESCLKTAPGLHLARLRRTVYKKYYQRRDNEQSDAENFILTSMYVVYVVHW